MVMALVIITAKNKKQKNKKTGCGKGNGDGNGKRNDNDKSRGNSSSSGSGNGGSNNNGQYRSIFLHNMEVIVQINKGKLSINNTYDRAVLPRHFYLHNRRHHHKPTSCARIPNYHK